MATRDSTITGGRRQRLRIACDPCRERKRKCDGRHPCEFCDGYGYNCTYRSTPRGRRTTSRTAPPPISQDSSTPRSAASAHSHSTATGNHQQQSQLPIPSTTVVPVPFAVPVLAVEHATQQSHQQERTPRDCEQQHQQQQQQQQQQRSPETVLRSVNSNSGAAFARSLTLALDPTHHDRAPMRMPAWNLFLGERRLSTPPQPSQLTAVLSEPEMQRLVAIYLDKVHPCYNFVPPAMLRQNVTSAWFDENSSSAQEALICGVGALASLFSGSQDLTTELSLVALAKSLLDPAVADRPSAQSAIAWLLRSVYLRLTAMPEEAWLASCTTLHIIDAAGLDEGGERSDMQALPQNSHDVRAGRRILAVAQHLNMWMSYDLGRCRVSLYGATPIVEHEQSSEYTAELMGLLPYTAALDPVKGVSVEGLTSAFVSVLSRNHSQPPSVLAQCNLMLCIHRRLHVLRSEIMEQTVTDVLGLIQRGMQAVRSCLTIGLPWHLVANVPFQAICALLALDNPQSFALLNDALSCLTNVNEVYQTKATNEAVTTARALLQLHQKRREADIRKHSEMLQLYPTNQNVSGQVSEEMDGVAFLDSWWWNEFIADQDLNINQPQPMS